MFCLKFNLTKPFLGDSVILLDPLFSQISPMDTFKNFVCINITKNAHCCNNKYGFVGDIYEINICI